MYSTYRNPKMGEIREVYFTEDKERHIQGGKRPAIIVQNDIGNNKSPIIIAVPLTNAEHKKNDNLPVHVFLDAKECGLPKDSVALCEQQQPRSKEDIGHYYGKLPDYYNVLIGAALTESTPMLAYMDDESLLKIFAMLRKKYGIIPCTKVMAIA